MLEMEKSEAMDKAFRDLIEIIHFTEKVSVKIHGVLDEADIYTAVAEEFARSKGHNVALMLMTNDESRLRIAGTSRTPRTLKKGEKASGLRLKEYKINLNKSSIYKQVVREGKTIQVNSRDIMDELFPRPLVYIIAKVIDFHNEKSIVTPLRLHGKIIGALTISSTELAEYFIPSVKNLAQHISNALELAHEYTAHKQMEETIKTSEKRLRDVIDTSPDAVVWVDVTGKITLVNRKGFELTGFSEKDLVGKNFMNVEALTQKSKEEIFESLMKRLKGIDTLPYEVEVVTKNGEIIPFELSASPIFEGGKIVGVQSILRDLRMRKKMEEKLRQYSEHLEELVQKRTEELLESEKRYSVLVEEASDGVTIIQDGKVVFANKKAAEIVDYLMDEIIGLPFEKVVDEKYLQLASEGYKRVIRGEKVPPIAELELVTKTGERAPIEASSTLINYQGRPANLVIVRDVSERKQMEEEHVKLEKLAAIGELATMVGHDLRNPLQAIENATYYLNNELPHLPPSATIPQKAIEMLQVINDSVNYADKIIRDLHDFSAPKKPTPEETNINALIKETLSQLEAPENVQVITELGRLPRIKVDKDMIKRVFLNLAINGIQAMEKGGTLKVSASRTKEVVEVSFKDTGAGMSRENIEKIFTPFFTTKAKGLGLGLAISKRFIVLHGGSIVVESREGKGSTFTVTLPIHEENGGEKPDEE
jgi:PAS domain S-box-containing protein